MQTGDNDQFLRFWYEVDIKKVGFGLSNAEEALKSNRKWFPYNKGGEFRKWYGNQEYVVNWENNGTEIKSNFDNKGKLRSRPQNTSYYFRQGITWSDVSSSYFGVRYLPKGFLFDVSGSMRFPDKEKQELLLGFMCSHISVEMLKILNPTLHFQVGNIKDLPIMIPDSKDEIKSMVNENIAISIEDWNSVETSWNFENHPLLCNQAGIIKLSDAYLAWIIQTENRFDRLKSNEESLNRIYIDLYGLQDELTPEVPDEEVTVFKAYRLRDTKSFLSYFIGCVMG